MIKTYVVDYDGTLELGEGKPNWPLIQKLNAAQAADAARVIVWSSRDWLYYDYIKFNLQHWGLKYEAIYCGKPLGDLYIDDKAVHWKEYLHAEQQNGDAVDGRSAGAGRDD